MLLTIFLASVFVFFLATYIYLSKYRGVVENLGLPYIKPFLIFGSPPFLFHTFNYHKWEAEQFKKFGKTWAKYDGSVPTIRTIDPEFIKEVTVKQFDNFHATLDIPLSDDQTTLDMSKGETWKALRKIMSPTFTTGRLKSMVEPMTGLADRTIDFLANQVEKNPGKINVKPILQGYTLDTIAKVGFGIDISSYKGENSEFMKNAQAVFEGIKIGSFGMAMFWNIFEHFPIISKWLPLWPPEGFKLRDITHNAIEARIKNNVEYGDFIDRLKAHKANLEPPLTPAMIDAQGMIFLTAGYETTANTLGHMIYLLAKNPDAQNRIYEDVANVCDDAEKIDHENIKEMHLLEAAISETLRLRPAATLHARQCTNDCEVLGIKIPKGTKILLPNMPSHLNEEFFPNPHEFQPERFLKENADQIIPFTWRPFGSGNRECIGKRFSIVEIMIFMAKFITKFKIVDIPETKTDYSFGEMFLLTYPKMEVRLELRA